MRGVDGLWFTAISDFVGSGGLEIAADSFFSGFESFESSSLMLDSLINGSQFEFAASCELSLKIDSDTCNSGLVLSSLSQILKSSFGKCEFFKTASEVSFV